MTGPSMRCSATTAAMCAWWCCTPMAGTPSAAASCTASWVLKKSGCRSCATAAMGAPWPASRTSTEASSAVQAAGSLRSPCTTDHTGRPSTSRQAAFFSQAPQASTVGKGAVFMACIGSERGVGGQRSAGFCEFDFQLCHTIAQHRFDG